MTDLHGDHGEFVYKPSWLTIVAGCLGTLLIFVLTWLATSGLLLLGLRIWGAEI